MQALIDNQESVRFERGASSHPAFFVPFHDDQANSWPAVDHLRLQMMPLPKPLDEENPPLLLGFDILLAVSVAIPSPHRQWGRQIGGAGLPR
jgi:hypothetical protein